MDLPRKRSGKYVTGIYAFFIVLFAFTLSLFYFSRCQKSQPSPEQKTAAISPDVSSERSPAVTKKIDIGSERLDDKIKAVGSEKNNEPMSATDPKEIIIPEDALRKGAAGYQTPLDRTTESATDPIRPPPHLKTGKNGAEIYFSDDSTGLTDAALEQLKRVFLTLLKDPHKNITIKGYGDSGKTNRHNISLSKLRAKIVEGYFVKRDISESRINTFWMGSEKSGEAIHDPDGSAKTHRVEINVK